MKVPAKLLMAGARMIDEETQDWVTVIQVRHHEQKTLNVDLEDKFNNFYCRNLPEDQPVEVRAN